MQKPTARTFTYLAAVLLPILLMGAVFAAMGAYPFGEKTLLVMDMDSEYIDYYAHLRRALLGEESLVRSWGMGMGLNMMGLVAFYTASPFLLLLVLFPATHLTEAVLLITLLKFGLAGGMFSLYARYTFPLEGACNAAFSTAWALCAYNVVYSSNLMWLDGSALLPLVLLGVERILREGKPGLFFGGLVYVFFTHYYIAYMIGAFSFLYLTAVYFSRHRSWRAYLGALKRFFGAALLAAGCCAFLLLPAFLELRSGQASMWNIPLELRFNHSFVDLSAKLLPGAYDSLTDSGTPNLWVTVLVVLLALLFFSAKGITRREKVVFGTLTAFLSLCLCVEALDLAWHAFEDPTWYPARYSFVFSFLLLYMGLRGLVQLQTVPLFRGGVCALLLAALFVEAGASGRDAVGISQVVSGLCLLFGYAALLLLWCRRGAARSGRVAAGALCLLLCVESGVGAHLLVTRVDEQFGYRSRAGYTGYLGRYRPLVDYLEERDNSVYRVEVTELRSANGGLALGYPGISHYSTTTDQQLNYFLEDLSYNHGTTNELRFAPTSPATNGLLGIRYVLVPSGGDMGPGYTFLAGSGEAGIWQNDLAYPLAFVAGEESLRFSGSRDMPFVLANEFAAHTAGTGGEGGAFYRPVEWRETLHNVVVDESDSTVYRRATTGLDSYAAYTVHNPEELPVYAYFPVAHRYSNTTVVMNGATVQKELAYRHNTMVSLGAGSAPTMEMHLDNGKNTMTYHQPQFYALDLAAAQAATQSAWERAVEFDRFDDTHLSGIVSAPEGGVLVTTFPYDEGWRVTLNGKRVPLERFGGVFLAVALEPGEHRLDMRYLAPGLGSGAAVSVVSVLAAAAAGYVSWRRRRVK